MFTITEAEAQSILPALISKGEAQARAGRVRLPTLIQCGEGGAVLLSEERWNEICREIGMSADEAGVARHISLQCGRAARGKSPLHCIITETVEKDSPVMIDAAGSRAVLVSEKEWGDIEETLYLLSIPGMKESILEGMKEDLSQCEELDP